MKQFFTLLFSLFVFQLISAQAHQNLKKTDSVLPKIALLGMFHFGATSDIGAIVMENPKGEQRQREIQQLIDRLKAYQPTKILVEYPSKKQDTLQSRYVKYQSGNFELPVNETYQVGFRLAHQLRHDSIYAVDYKLDMPFEQLMQYCQEKNCMEKFQNIVNMAQSYTAEETKVLQKMELSPFLLRMNTDASDRFGNGLYLREVLDIGDPDNEVGAGVNAAWYQRNMIILKNIVRHIQNSEERILVIIGASHRAIIKDYLNNLEEYEYVEVGKYLD